MAISGVRIHWTAPSPIPSCGYKVLYRRNADPSYTERDIISGTTTTIVVTAPACYEGLVKSDCCGDSVAPGIPFGVNAYQPLTLVSITIDPITRQYTANVTSRYANSYDIIFSALFTLNGTPGFSAIFTYPAGSTDATVLSTATAPSVDDTITDIAFQTLVPIFNNGGAIQQLDAVNTPPYFKFYPEGDVSGTTWAGSPSDLPSCILTAFTPTEIDIDGNVISGTLQMSYILDQIIDNSFDNVIINVYDDNLALVGTITSLKTPLGIRYETISLIDVDDNYFTTEMLLTMEVLWPDESLINSVRFQLPLF